MRIRCVCPRNCMSAPCKTTRLDDLVLLGRIDALALGALRAQRLRHDLHVEAVERRVDGVDEILPQIGDEAAERVGEPGPRRHHHLRQSQLAGDRHRVQRPRPAEGEEHEIARIVAARQRHHADGAGHVRVGEPDHRRRRIFRREPERRCDLRRKRRGAPARSLACRSTALRPAGSSRPSRRCASVMVGRVPPRP